MLSHHPRGGGLDGEHMTAIDPYFFKASTIKFPSIEATLAGHFTRRGKRMHKTVARVVFQEDISVTRDFLLQKGWIRDKFDISVIAHLVRTNHAEVDDFLKWYDTLDHGDATKRFAAMEDIIHNPLKDCMNGNTKTDISGILPPMVWEDESLGSYEDWKTKYSWYATAWFRINVSQSLLEYETRYMSKNPFFKIKIKEFQNLHLDFIQGGQYKSKKSYHDDDRQFRVIETQTIQKRRLPLEILRTEFPFKKWSIEEIDATAISNVDYDPLNKLNDPDYRIYSAACFILQQCIDCFETSQDTQVRDACYFYYGCFTDMFYHALSVGNFSDAYLLTPGDTGLTPYEFLYPTDTRVFLSWDLPDIYSVLCGIPLSGKQENHPTKIGYILQKTLPFCGMRRSLVPIVLKEMKTNEAFFNVVSCVTWCNLANMFPSELAVTRNFDMRKLLRAKEISEKKHLLLEAIGRENITPKGKSFKKETTKNCPIIYTMFRMWILQNTLESDVYVNYAKECINWDDFVQSTRDKLLKIQDSNIYTQDVFSAARQTLAKCEETVYRMRKKTPIDLISGYLSNTLEKTLYNQMRILKQMITDFKSDDKIPDVYSKFDKLHVLSEMEKDLAKMDCSVEQSTKENILNTISRIPHFKWLTFETISLLMLERLGGISYDAVLTTMELITLYDSDGRPKNFAESIGDYSVREFGIVIWFFHTLVVLGDIKLIPLNNELTERIDDAMKRVRYPALDRNSLSPYVYDVFITVCCNTIVTLHGQNKYGHKKVAYDEERQTFVCAKAQKKKVDDDDAETLYSQKRQARKEARDQRKQFKSIPCKNQQVLRINIKGHRIVHAGQCYMHCPSCGGFHEYNPANWGYSPNGYRCRECIIKSEEPLCLTCSYCKGKVPTDPAKQKIITVIDDTNVKEGPTLQNVYFCASHYKYAIRYERLDIPLTKILKKIQLGVSNQQKRNAASAY